MTQEGGISLSIKIHLHLSGLSGLPLTVKREKRALQESNNPKEVSKVSQTDHSLEMLVSLDWI